MNISLSLHEMKGKEMSPTIVANVTEMEIKDALLRLTSIAVPRAVGTTVKGKVHLWH